MGSVRRGRSWCYSDKRVVVPGRSLYCWFEAIYCCRYSFHSSCTYPFLLLLEDRFPFWIDLFQNDFLLLYDTSRQFSLECRSGGLLLGCIACRTNFSTRSVRCRTIFVRTNDPGPWEFRLDDGRAGYWNGKPPFGVPEGRD